MNETEKNNLTGKELKTLVNKNVNWIRGKKLNSEHFNKEPENIKWITRNE